ncbi:MAG: BREX-4 system phosphatase PglZ, partial [Christensenellaceae bacterium]|nr:BREX-4 system phosphatase PglZ [Christensenellaceae bacterium]
EDITSTAFRDLLFKLGVDLSSAIKKFKSYDDTQKWRIFLWLKIEPNKGYLSLVAKEAKNVDDVVTAVYNAILAIDTKHKLFDDFYTQRKDLIIALDDIRAIKQFANQSGAKEKDKVYYLTDSTDVERKEIITCFTKYDYTVDEIREIATRVYPLLAEYLHPFTFNNAVLDDYFDDYKINKLRNILPDAFKEKVEKHAAAPRPFLELPTRAKVISKINADNAIVYWVDALGVEFCAYINQRCKAYRLSAKIQTARAELPTLTKFNKDFSPLVVYRDIKELDSLKHEGVGDHDYTKSTLPLYIESELAIIDKIIKNVQTDLANKKKVIIVSDHGASRLVRIADNILTIAVDSKGDEKDEKHGGRCCAWNPDIPAQYDTVTDVDNNGFCVIANYDRFKGGKYTGVELHGGATLEEVVVPIIEITNKTTDYKYTLTSAILKLRQSITEPLVISLSSEISMPRIKIQGQTDYISPIKVDETTYTFETNITVSGKKECAFFDDNEEIIHCITFEVKNAIGDINDPLRSKKDGKHSIC